MRYTLVTERVAAVNAARAAWEATDKRFTAANTNEAHMADDYGEPHTELQQASTAHYAASAALDKAEDELIVGCAYLCTIDATLSAKLLARIARSTVESELARRILNEVDTEPADDAR